MPFNLIAKLGQRQGVWADALSRDFDPLTTHRVRLWYYFRTSFFADLPKNFSEGASYTKFWESARRKSAIFRQIFVKKPKLYCFLFFFKNTLAAQKTLMTLAGFLFLQYLD